MEEAVADIQKRRGGAPTSGRVSIVVTDIESYSALMVKMPLAMGQAVSQHSNVIRRAAWTHYGFVVGQEGDSFILAFRDACDAVAFCLQVQQGLVKVHWPSELLQHQQQQDLAAAAPTVQQLLGSGPSGAAAAAAASDLQGASTQAGETGTPSVSLLNGSPSASPIQSFSGGVTSGPTASRRADSLAAGVMPGTPPAAAAAGRAAAQGQDAPWSAGAESTGQTTLLDLLLQRTGSSRLCSKQQQQQQQQGPDGVRTPAAVNGNAGAGESPTAAAGPGVHVKRHSTSDTGAPGSPGSSAVSYTTWTQRDSSSSFLRPAPSGSISVAGLTAYEGGRPLSPVQQQQQQQWLAPASVLVPGLRVRMGVASGVLGDQEECLSSKVMEAAKVVSDAGSGGQVLLDSVTFSSIKDRLEELGQVGASGYISSSRVTGWGTPKGWLARVARRRVELAAEAVVLDMGLYSLPAAAVKSGRDHQGLLPELPAAAAVAAAAAAPAQEGISAAMRSQASPMGDTAPATVVAAGKQRGVSQHKAADGCVRLYQVLAPKCVPRALLFGNNLSLKQGARCHDLPYFCAPAAASRSLLDMLLVDGPDGGHHITRSFSNISSWAGSRLWLRHKYRLPLVATTVAGAANGSTSVRQGRGSPTPARSPFSGLVSVPVGFTPSKYGGVAMLLSPPPSRAQSASLSLYAKQPAATTISEQQQQPQLTAAPAGTNGLSGPAATNATAAAAANTGGTQSDSAHGSLQSATTSTSAWPVVSIPLRGLGTLWSSAFSEGSNDGPCAVHGITFVFASAALPRSLKLEGGHLAAHISSMIGTVVRQTLMAFTAAAVAAVAAADGSGLGVGVAAGSSSSSSKAAAVGYLFRESSADMKYLLAFQSPKAALEWCLLAQEALLWQDWPAAHTGGTRTAEPSTHSLATTPPAPTHAAQAQAGMQHRDNTDRLSPAAAAAAGAGAGAADVGVNSHVLLSGPRLKMGVAAGAPHSVTPDHMGRADYHGNAVNMAARYEAVCAQPGQIVCDAALAESVMAEWAAAAAEAAAVQQQLRHMAAGTQGSPTATVAAAAAAAGDDAQQQQQQQQQQRVGRQSNSPFAAAAQQSRLGQMQQQQQGTERGAAASRRGSIQIADSLGGPSLWPEPTLSSSMSEATTGAVSGDNPAAAAAAGGGGGGGGSSADQQSESSVHSFTPTAAGTAAGAAAAAGGSGGVGGGSVRPGPQGEEEPFGASFALPCPAPAGQPGSVTSPFARVSVGALQRSAAAAAESAAAAGAQAMPQRVRSIPHKHPNGAPSNRSVVGSAPTVTSAGSSLTARGSPPRISAAAAAAPGRASLESRPSSTAAVIPTQRRASTPGALTEAGSVSSSVWGTGRGDATATAAAAAAGSGGGGGYPGVAGLGGGFGFYGSGSSRRLSVNPRNSPAWSSELQQQQQRGPRSSKSGNIKGASGSGTAAAVAAPPQLLPLQPPVALPCPAAVPEGLPTFEVAVETHRLGRYNFKGAAAPIAMVEVVATHLLPRRQHLQDPAQLPKGPKGGSAELQQGLVEAVQGIRLPGLAHVYRQMYSERNTAAAAAVAAAAAQQNKGVFGVHRFLRPSLQLQLQHETTGGTAGSSNTAAGRVAGSISSSSSVGFGAGHNSGSAVGRLSGLLARSLSQATSSVSGARRLSVTSVGSGQGGNSRPGSTGGAAPAVVAEGAGI